jgi:ABC-type antimicrobial peptide transport system permease subunit
MGSSNEERTMKRDRENRIVDEIVQKMNSSPLFTYWTYGTSPYESNFSYSSKFKLLDGEFKEVNRVSVDESWLRLFDIQLKEGRLWDDNIDEFCQYVLIASESVLKLYGITDINNVALQPETRLWFSMDRPEEEMKTNPPYRIAGVVKDFDYLHLSQKSKPMVFTYSPGGRYNPLIASIVPGRTHDAIEFMKNLHNETVGGEFMYSFVEDEVHQMYKEDKKIASIYSIFTFIAIFIAALGLLSMSLFDIQQRHREIAIRKINGASFNDVIRLLLKKYFWSVLISFVIATPVALFAINRYLEDFAHKAPVSWWLFAVAVALTASISLMTLLFQTQKAAKENPAEALKKS